MSGKQSRRIRKAARRMIANTMPDKRYRGLYQDIVKRLKHLVNTKQLSYPLE